MENIAISKKEVFNTILEIYSERSLSIVYPQEPIVSCEELISKIDKIPIFTFEDWISNKAKKLIDDVRNEKYSDDYLQNIAIQTIVINKITELLEDI